MLNSIQLFEVVGRHIYPAAVRRRDIERWTKDGETDQNHIKSNSLNFCATKNQIFSDMATETS
jgi:hypothetical protein